MLPLCPSILQWDRLDFITGALWKTSGWLAVNSVISTKEYSVFSLHETSV